MCIGSDFYLHCALMIREREPPPAAPWQVAPESFCLQLRGLRVSIRLTAERTAAVSWGLALGPQPGLVEAHFKTRGGDFMEKCVSSVLQAA